MGDEMTETELLASLPDNVYSIYSWKPAKEIAHLFRKEFTGCDAAGFTVAYGNVDDGWYPVKSRVLEKMYAQDPKHWERIK